MYFCKGDGYQILILESTVKACFSRGEHPWIRIHIHLHTHIHTLYTLFVLPRATCHFLASSLTYRCMFSCRVAELGAVTRTTKSLKRNFRMLILTFLLQKTGSKDLKRIIQKIVFGRSPHQPIICWH